MAPPRRKLPSSSEALKLNTTFLHSSPDGQNINENCGALHPETGGGVCRRRSGKFDVGVTFDGDADRALFCDAQGRVVNGDAVLLWRRVKCSPAVRWRKAL